MPFVWIFLVLLILVSVGITIAARYYHGTMLNPMLILVLIHFFGNWIRALFCSLGLLPKDIYYGTAPHLMMLQFNLLVLVVLAAGYFIGNSWAKPRDAMRERAYIADYLSPSVLEVLYFIMVFVTYMFFFVPVVSIGRGAYGMRGFNPYTLLAVRGPLIVMATAIRYATDTKKWWPLCTAIVLEICFAFLSGDRDQVFYLFIGVGFTHILFTRHVTRTYIVAAVAVFLILMLSELIHSAGGKERMSAGQRINIGTETIASKGAKKVVFSGLASVSSEYVQCWFIDLWFFSSEVRTGRLEYGRTYLYSAINLIVPRFWQGEMMRWQATGIFKGEAYEGRTTAMGYEFAFTSEAILNFGPWLGLVSPLIIAIVFGYSYQRYLSRGSIGTLLFLIILLVCYFRYVRCDSTTFSRILTMALFFYWFFRRIVRRGVHRAVFYPGRSADLVDDPNTALEDTAVFVGQR